MGRSVTGSREVGRGMKITKERLEVWKMVKRWVEV